MDAESLVRTLRAYDPSTDAAAVKAAFSDPKSLDKSRDFVRWAARHLTPDTLLSADELDQYAAVEESGLAERLAMSSHRTDARVLSDHEIQNAIHELNRSTQAITRHTETLKQQRDAFERLADGARQAREERAAVEAGQSQKWEGQRRHLASATDELSQSLGARTLGLEQHSSAAESTIQQTVDTLFRSDDRLLDSLQKLGWELETENPEEKDRVVMLRETCARLIKFTVEGIRTRLDRIYLESLELAAQPGATRRATPDEVSSLQEELESLYAEILPVAQMSTEQEFLEPALKALAAKNGHGLVKSAQATSYIHDCLDYLIDRAHDLMARLEAFQGYQLAADAVLDIARFELAREAAVSTPLPRRPTVDQQNGMSPVRPKQKHQPTDSDSTAGIGAEPPLQEILRTLAISLPQEDESAVDVQGPVPQLASTLAGRRSKAEDVARNVQETFESAAAKQIEDGKLAIQLVRDSILAESPFGEVRLVDPEIEGSIAVLSQELANVDGKLRAVDARLPKLRGRDPKRDELIRRWGP
ncbi:hypothetical protein BT67DRAFT_270310 [Trichocladium antarcticum]|uniref:Uncharacterized protein n=1 Tax=Trichocladium antarcticum TaxID=1450529 RepID=A0AAN6ZDP9_9PEZI|nr:hypothetical protein BT67DRAFT_270310 [Trichocladium antarcticum]